MSTPSTSYYLSPTSREVVESFVRRSEFWLQMPTSHRRLIWQFDNPEDAGYDYTAPDIVAFTEANCFAVTAASDDKLLNEFKNKLQTEWASSQTIPYEGMDLARLISEYVVWVDHLFFFGLLTGATLVDNELRAKKQLFKLAAYGGLKNAAGQELEGIYKPDIAELAVNMLQSSGKFITIDHALCVVAHEMTHVYLDVLTRDNSPANFYKHVYQLNGHGVQFHELLHFILAQLYKLVPTMPYLVRLAIVTQDDLRRTLARPDVSSDGEAMELIGDGRLSSSIP